VGFDEKKKKKMPSNNLIQIHGIAIKKIKKILLTKLNC
jgi:hypothetical protein